MQKDGIYYFTGSGNSLAVARQLAENLYAELVPIPADNNPKSNYLSADIIGIVFPIYNFKADETCNLCGICERLCPVGNISITGKLSPTWSDKRIGCFACLYWCPKDSVKLGGYDFHIRQYHHPDVTLRDIIRGR